MMKERKNIDRLFQEKFKDFEVTPDEAVWEKIKAQQAKKNKKRVVIIPLWFRIAGAAALIVLLFSVGSVWMAQDPTQPVITNTDTTNQKTNKDEDFVENSIKEDPLVEKTDIKNTSITDETERNEDELVNSNTIRKTKNPIANTSRETKRTNTSTNNQQFISEKNGNSDNDQYQPKTNTVIAESLTEQHESAQQNAEKTIRIAEQLDDNKNVIQSENRKSDSDHNVSDAIAEKAEKNEEDLEKKSIFDVIQEEKEKKEAKVATTNAKRWKVAPTVAPVYYNSLGNGSSIDAEFVDNTKEGQVNMSYGVQIAYTINKKLSIRSGINSINLGYGTQDVGFSPSTSAQSLNNVSYSENSKAIQVSDYNPATPSRSLLASEANSTQKFSLQNKGVLNLVMNYIEIPMEMKYALVDKKLGVNLIGGVSTLFLQDNQLSINAGNFTTDVGETTNLNEVSFSSNIGIGVDYELSDKFQVQMEPIFKYQINAYDNTSGNFNPYYFGIYTGVSYRF